MNGVKCITIMGNGNVGIHFFEFFKSKFKTQIINSHTLENLPDYTDLIIICVKDDVIERVASKIKRKDAIIVHTAGSVDKNVLSNYADNYGVIYPLQTFSKGINLDYSEIPFLIEGNNEACTKTLMSLLHSLTSNVYECNSEERKIYHLASVFACNFTNAMIDISYSLLESKHLDSKLVYPLIKQTIRKLEFISPQEAQTGPAVRKDRNILKDHITLLKDKMEISDIYSSISHYIMTRKNDKKNEMEL